MSAIDDGGAAFPIKGYCVDASGALCGEVITHAGMTLRDWFAGQALVGVLANPNSQAACDAIARGGLSPIDFTGQYVYCLADAMLAARKGGER